MDNDDVKLFEFAIENGYEAVSARSMINRHSEYEAEIILENYDGSTVVMSGSMDLFYRAREELG